MEYFGPNMQAVLRECNRLGISWQHEGLHFLAHKLNKITGLKVSDSTEPEQAAAMWLPVLEARPSR